MTGKRLLSKTIQWLCAITFALAALGSGSFVAGSLILVSAILMLPLPRLRSFLLKRKIKSWMAILLSVVLFFVGIGLMPATEEDGTGDTGIVTESIEKDTEKAETENANSDAETSEQSGNGEITEQAQASSDSSTSSNNITSNQTSNIPQESQSVGNGTATPVAPSSIPAYSGSPYVVLNNNQPSFSAAELTTKGYETYSSLDSLGRCGRAVASCGREIMPAAGEERGSISSIIPSGWIQAKYDCVSGKYLYNRCHLIGWQLSAENANRQNLITGTRYLNTEGMLLFENMVADYIRETGNHVAYRITPIYEGNNLLASGVEMEAYSIEDQGEGICFHVYCYNVQPGVTINYANGASSGPESESTGSGISSNTSTGASSGSVSVPASPSEPTGQMVYRTPTGKKYHLIATCGGQNSYEVTLDAALGAGLGPCAKCAQ